VSTEHSAQAADKALPDLLRAFAADALRYWEPRRAIFNGVLALVVGVHVAGNWPSSGARIVDFSLLLFFMAVLANVLYCIAYVADLFVQFAGLARAWRWFRPALLTIGTTFAATIAHWIVGVLLAPPID